MLSIYKNNCLFLKTEFVILNTMCFTYSYSRMNSYSYYTHLLHTINTKHYTHDTTLHTPQTLHAPHYTHHKHYTHYKHYNTPHLTTLITLHYTHHTNYTHYIPHTTYTLHIYTPIHSTPILPITHSTHYYTENTTSTDSATRISDSQTSSNSSSSNSRVAPSFTMRRQLQMEEDQKLRLMTLRQVALSMYYNVYYVIYVVGRCYVILVCIQITSPV